MANTSSEQILRRFKGLRTQMRADEHPLFTVPAIWDNATEKQSNACDLVLTNQRLFGYIHVSVPRERTFLDALELAQIKKVSLRQKTFEAVFRELFVSDGEKKIYIRAPRKKIENMYKALRAAIAEYVPAAQAALVADEPTSGQEDQTEEHDKSPNALVYSRQRVQQSLERSPMGITLLLTGGLLLEIVGVIVWVATASLQTGLPLFGAGLLAVLVAILARRQLR